MAIENAFDTVEIDIYVSINSQYSEIDNETWIFAKDWILKYNLNCTYNAAKQSADELSVGHGAAIAN